MAGVEEQYRRRIAYLLMGVGMFFLLSGVALVVDNYLDIQSRTIRMQSPTTHPHTTQPDTVQPSDTPPVVSAQTKVQANAMQRFLFWLLVLAGIFFIGLLAFLRWSRSYRRWVLHEPASPTPAEDVWAMHRLPDEEPTEKE